MRKVMIYAYTRFNLGDDLFIKTLIERYPKTKFYLCAPKQYEEMFKKNKNLKIYSTDSLFAKGLNMSSRITGIYDVFQRIVARKCDGVVYIGGSIFMQQKNWKTTYKRKQKMRIKGKPFFVMGANFGPYKSQDFYNAYKEEFQLYTDICFREEYSYQLFNDLQNVRVADDVVFQLKVKENRNSQENSCKKAVISIIKPSIRQDLLKYDEIYFNKMREAIISLVKKDYKVVLMSFCEYEKDEEAIESIIQTIPSEYKSNIDSYYYRNNIEEALQIIEGSNLMVATRFHSMILGWIYKMPVFPVAYSKKMINVLEDIEFQGEYIDLKNIENLNVKDIHNAINNGTIDISNQVKSAQQQFKILDSYLGK